MPIMKRIARFLTVASHLVCVNALSQAKQEKPVETNVCDIANNPVQFKGSWCRFDLKSGLTRLP